MTVLRVTDQASRAEIEAAIAEQKAKYDRLPAHYERQRTEIMDTIDELVDQWLAADR